jgi:hypothetical protein
MVREQENIQAPVPGNAILSARNFLRKGAAVQPLKGVLPVKDHQEKTNHLLLRASFEVYFNDLLDAAACHLEITDRPITRELILEAAVELFRVHGLERDNWIHWYEESPEKTRVQARRAVRKFFPEIIE